MELMAVIAGLKALKSNQYPVKIYSDSTYVVHAIDKGWLDKWIRTGFKGGIKNKDLWMAFHALASNFRIRFYWVKGHAENPYNNRCDELATQAADSGNLMPDDGYEASLS